MKSIKFTLLLVAFCILGATASYGQSQANAIDKYFKQYVDSKDFTVVYISGKMFELFGKLDIDKETLDLDDEADVEAIMDIARDMKGLRILTTDINVSQYYKEAKAKINTGEYEVLMTVRTRDGDNVEFLILENKANNKIAELLLLVGGDDFVLLSFVGNLDLDKIVKLANEMEKD